MSTDETNAARRGSGSNDLLGLVERMRFLASGQDDPHSVALTEAADELERLRGIVPEVLERLNDELCAENERLHAELDAMCANFDAMRLEKNRLRARLEKAEHWAQHAMLMRSSQNAELLRILRDDA